MFLGKKWFYRLKPRFNLCNAGGGSEVAARALSLPDLNQLHTSTPPAGLESQERTVMQQEIGEIENMISDMELKVNVLHWTVEPQGKQHADPVSSTDTVSLALHSVDEEQPEHRPVSRYSHIFLLLLLFAVVLVAVTLCVCVVFFWATFSYMQDTSSWHSVIITKKLCKYSSFQLLYL